jgi:hypothetical protein
MYVETYTRIFNIRPEIRSHYGYKFSVALPRYVDSIQEGKKKRPFFLGDKTDYEALRRTDTPMESLTLSTNPRS